MRTAGVILDRHKKIVSKDEFTLVVHSHGPTISFVLASIHYDPPVKKLQASYLEIKLKLLLILVIIYLCNIKYAILNFLCEFDAMHHASFCIHIVFMNT